MKRSAISMLLTGLLLVGLLAEGCASTPTPGTKSGEPSGGTTVTDALGRTLDFATPPQRIVVGGRNSLMVVEALYLFPEAKERIAGTGGGKQNPAAFIGLIDPTFGTKAELDADAGAEQIASLHPDAVVMKSLNAETTGKGLEALGIPVVYVDLETPEQFTRDVATLGQLLGNPKRAQEILSFYQAKLQAIDKGLQGVMDSARPRALVMQYSEKGGEIALSVPSAARLQTLMVELAGGVAIWKEAAQGAGSITVNLEQIAAWDPDTILIVSYTADSREIVDKLEADSRWQALKAAQEGHIYGFPGDIFSWDQPDPRWILGLTWIAAQMHPARFPELDMLEETAEFFERMYGMDRASFEANILPRIHGDLQ